MVLYFMEPPLKTSILHRTRYFIACKLLGHYYYLSRLPFVVIPLSCPCDNNDNIYTWHQQTVWIFHMTITF